MVFFAAEEFNGLWSPVVASSDPSVWCESCCTPTITEAEFVRRALEQHQADMADVAWLAGVVPRDSRTDDVGGYTCTGTRRSAERAARRWSGAQVDQLSVS